MNRCLGKSKEKNKEKDVRGNNKSSGLDRRDFLQYGLMGGAFAFAGAMIPGSRAMVAGSATKAGGTAAMAPAIKASVTRPKLIPTKPFELEEATIADLQKRMASGELTARSITEMYLARIEEIDKKGPVINSVLEINPDALAIADELDAERQAKGSRGMGQEVGRLLHDSGGKSQGFSGPLHGIPILIKDNIATHDRMTTTAGSLALKGSVPAKDSFVARKLREAGAIILGKTNLSEWANFRSMRSSSGWSARGGQTLNPYALDRNPCGSSSGSGAAASANLCAAAIGTETDGSVVCPSNANSLVGIKPTLGLVSRSGIIPIAHSQDTAGPMCRTVTDAAILLGALTGIDPKDSSTKESIGRSYTDYTRFLDPKGLKGARLGIARNLFGFHDRVDKLINESIAEMKRLGAVIIDPVDIPTAKELDETELEVLLYEFKADLNAYLAGLGPDAPIHSLKEIIEFNEKNRDSEMPYFSQELFYMAEEKGPLTDRAYRSALKKNHRLSRKEGIDAVIRKHKLDAIVAPTGGPPWMTDLVNGDHYIGGSSSLAAVAGYPNITVPAGYIFGLPVGISFFGKAYSEPTLIKIAYAYEQATKFRKPPKFLPTADLST